MTSNWQVRVWVGDEGGLVKEDNCTDKNNYELRDSVSINFKTSSILNKNGTGKNNIETIHKHTNCVDAWSNFHGSPTSCIQLVWKIF